jgi:threonine/homoserine/homoserine lactone efflux protein
MTVVQALIAFSIAAGLLTVTPGLDTALVLRTAAAEGPKKAAMAAAGVCLGTVVWAAAVGLGLGALLAASKLAYDILKWAGAAYLVWLGAHLLLRPRDRFEIAATASARGVSASGWFGRGVLNNLLNPKAGVFYVSFLPQFVPPTAPAAPFMILLGTLHAAMGAVWFGAIIGATRPISGALQKARVVRWLDRLTGGVFVGFGVRLALERR